MNAAEMRSAAKIVQALTQNKMLAYEPYPKQEEFHANGATHRERCFLAANQSGKTLSAGDEVAFHTTGRYPAWWKGRRFDGPVRCWVAGTSAEGTRDTVQRILLGEGGPDSYGTGTIPKSALKEVKQARTVANAVNQIFVKHITGGTSYIGFRNYKQDLEGWAGDSLNVLWCDEEPPAKHYSEGLTRLNARQGIAFTTMTPLLGMTNFVKKFYPEPTTADRALTMMTIDDVGHFTQAQKDQIIAAYMPYEQDARTRGIPMLGEGRVFPISRSEIECDSFEIPDHWPILGAIDFGWNHPTGAVSIAWDRDSDTIYVTREYREKERTPEQSASTLMHWDKGMRWAWPHDGGIEQDRGSGLTTAQQYRRAGLTMLPENATFEDGGHSFYAGIQDMLMRMQDGRLKVFKHLQGWFSEFEVYHYKDIKVIKEGDDLLSATRVAIMAKRFGRTSEPRVKFQTNAGQSYDPLSPGGGY